MCGHQALDHNPQNEGRNFCRYLIWGYLGPDMAKMWIFGNRPKWLEKGSLYMKECQTCPKSAWGEYLHPPGTLWSVGSKSKKFIIFCHWTCNQNFDMCRMGAHTHPKPFSWKFSTFSKKIECIWYLDHFRVTKTRRDLWSEKTFKTSFLSS